MSYGSMRGNSVGTMRTLGLVFALSLGCPCWAVELCVTTDSSPWQDRTDTVRGSGHEGLPTVEIFRDKADQTMLGFGVCMSELSHQALWSLPDSERRDVLDELFLEARCGLSVIRTPIGANDFARDFYSYAETPDDFEMKNFTVAHDEEALLPLIREVQRRVPGDALKIWASPWCPPRWMKTNGHYASRPDKVNDLDDAHRIFEGEDGFVCDDAHMRAYALYFRRYVESYRAKGVPLWMVMPQNEFNSAQNFPSCTWSAGQLARFIGKYLGPALEGTGVEIFLGTMERPNDGLLGATLERPAYAKYITGAGFQWAGKDALPAVRKRYPQLAFVMTEQECGDGSNGWEHAMHCWDLMRHYLSNGVSAYCYWNLALKKDGLSRWGWRQNSLVVVDAETHRAAFTPEYYLLKHVSHYVRRGAKRLITGGTYAEALAFANPDGSVVVMLANPGRSECAVSVQIDGHAHVVTLPASSVATLALPSLPPVAGSGVPARSDAGHAASVTYRFSQANWVPDDAFTNLVAFLLEHRTTGKVALFTCDQHSPPALDRVLSLMPVLERRMATLRDLGYEAGINHLCTIGQTEEGVAYAEKMAGTEPFTSANGGKSLTNRCPNDRVWRERYVRPIYEALARTKPDFIWIDDDLRMAWHGTAAGLACFCPNCMKRIRERLGYAGDREGLEAFLADPEQGLERRRAVMQLTRDTLGDIIAYVRGVVRGVSPSIVLGGMDGAGPWEGWGYAEKIGALATPGEKSYWRPGSGFYDDEKPWVMLLKANDLGQVAALLPDRVTKVESEIECFNYQRLAKGEQIVVTEALAYIAAGTRGTAWNVLADPVNDDLATFGSLFDRLEALRPQMDAMVRAGGHARPRGVWDCRTGNSYAGLEPGRKWLTPQSEDERSFPGSDLQRLGIPVAYREEEAEVYAPTAAAILEMSDDRLDRLLSKGVYVSPRALRAFALRGRTEEVGFELGETLSHETLREKLVEHPLNVGFVGRERDARLAFWPGEVATFRPRPGARNVARCVDVGGGERAACVAGTFENARGGRIYVSGFFPYDRQLYRPSAQRLRRVFDWLSYGRLTGVVDTYCRASLWVRGDLVSLLNLSFDAIEGPEILLRGEKWSHGVRVLGPRGGAVLAPVREGDRTRYRLPRVDAWSLLAVECAGN